MGKKQDHFEKAADKNDFSLSDIKEADEKIQSAIQSRLNRHWKQSRLRGGEDYWLFEDDHGVWLVFSEYEIYEELREAKIECDNRLVQVVALGHLEEFQQTGCTIAVPGGIARYHKSNNWYPIYVPFPEEWQNGEWHSFQRMHELVCRYELSPAEALDFWAVERHGEDAISWGGKRDVQAEAVRKNVRQAEEKLNDEELGAGHPKERFQVVPVDDVPYETPPDEEKDLFYIPTEEQENELNDE